MSRRLEEETLIFAGVVKWVLLATVAGAIVGLSTTVFLKLLVLISDRTEHYRHYYFLLPAAIFVSVLLIQYLAPDAEGHGTEKVIEAIHKHAGRIKPLVVPVKLVATLVTLAFGGSVGKEGPCAQIGAGITSVLADLFRFDDTDRRRLVICGISAGFASVFGTPIAGAIFGVEVLFVGSMLYDVLLPSFVAGVTSYHVSTALGITYFYRPLAFVPVFSEGFFIKVLIAGVFFGLCAALLAESLRVGERLFKSIPVWPPLRGVIGGALLVGLTLLFSGRYLGLGLDTIQCALEGGKVLWCAFLLKILFTCITLISGGSGGIVTPIYFVGAAAGSLFGGLIGCDPATFAAIGLVSVLAGAANAPIAASIMAVELFGAQVAPYASVACVVSFMMMGHRSVYPSQILAIRKSRMIQARTGEEIEKVESELEREKGTLVARAWQEIKGLWRRVRDSNPR